VPDRRRWSGDHGENALVELPSGLGMVSALTAANRPVRNSKKSLEMKPCRSADSGKFLEWLPKPPRQLRAVNFWREVIPARHSTGSNRDHFPFRPTSLESMPEKLLNCPAVSLVALRQYEPALSAQLSESFGRLQLIARAILLAFARQPSAPHFRVRPMDCLRVNKR